MIYKSYQIEKSLASLSNNFLLFYGENLGFKNEIKKNLKSANPKTKFTNLIQEEILKNQSDFYDNLFNLSLFNDKEIYIIDNVNDKILDVIEEVQKKIDTQKIYLFAEVLDKKSKLRNYFEKSKDKAIIACYNDNEVSIKKIILSRLQKFEGLTTESINIIINNSNLDRIKLNNELDKIETFFSNKKISSIKLIDLLNLNENEDFNLIKDSALNGDLIKTNKLLNNTIIEDEKISFYIHTINQRFNKLYEILSLNKKSLENGIDDLRPPIFWKDKPNILIQLKKWNKKKINEIFRKTYEIEVTFKTKSFITKNILIKKLLVDICKYANS